MANSISGVTTVNPYGAKDTCANIKTDAKSTLIISECMPYISEYTFQFWIKSKGNKTVIFNCDSNVRKIYTTPDWQYFTITFKVNSISNITLLFPKGEFWIYNTKLEIGSYDTDWSPHPEDVQADVKNLESKIQDLDDKLLLKQTETISTAIDLINKQELYTERSLTRTQFVSEIYGILSGINANLDDIQEGNGKWHVSIYDKNDFLKLTKMPSGETDWDTNQYSLPTDVDDTDTVYDDGSVWDSSDTQIVPENENEQDDDENNLIEDENTGDSGESPYESPLDNDEEDIDDRDRIDMKIFSMENSDILPLEELLIEDEPQKLRIEGKGKIIYYYTFAKFTEDFQGLINCPFKDASLYINGVLIISQAVIGTRKAMVQFLKGWNLIEIISNEGNFTIDPSISSLEQCEVINCLVAVPTNRNVKVSTKSSGIYTTIDQILSEVWEYALEQYTDENGNVHSRKVLEGSRIKQTKDMISLLVKSASGDYSDLQVTPKFIDAITKKFTVTDPTTGKRVIIAGGKIISESIDTDMLNTDVITSKNFDGGYKAPVRIRNTETGVEREFNKMNLDELFDENGEIVFNEHGTYLDLASGNFISPSMIILNEYSYTPEGESIPITIQNKAYFKGDVYADNGYFNGDVNSNAGHIGPWVIDSSAIYKGEYTQGLSKLGVHGEEYAYIGDDGLSLSDLFIYDSKNQTLRLRVNTLDISGQDIIDFTTTAVDGNNTYYVQLLSDINALVQSWNNELSKHLDETCYVISTGKLYRFVKKSTLSANDKIALILYNITFNDSTELRAGDYISIYYKYGKSIYKVVSNPLVPSSGNYSLSSLAGATITIPSDDFYVFLHVGEESSGLVDYYGFTIDDMSSEYGEIEDVTFGIRANLPNYPMDRTLAVNEFPETSHPYVLALTNKLWQVRTSLANNADDYEWVEIVNQEYAEGARNALRALTYMHYDATNGLILHNGLQPLPIDGTVPTQETLNGLEGGNVRITSNGMDVYIGNYLIARYGPSSIFYYYDSTDNTTEERLVLNSEGVKVKNGTFMLGEYQRDLGNGSTTTDYKFKVFDDGNFLLGTSNGEHIQYDNGHLDLSVSSLSVGASDITDVINDTTQNTQELAKRYIKENFEDYIDDIKSNDYKITFWYSATAPDQEYEWEENLVSDLHTYDIWHNTTNDTYQMYKLIDDPPVIYMGWESIPEPPNCLKDIDHSMNIYFADSITQITGLEVNDLWYRGEEASLLIYVFKDGAHQWTEYDKYASNLAQIESFKEQYQNELRALSNQLDGKAQTYEQPNDPSVSWSTPELKKQHVGDLWHDAEYDSYGAQIGNDLYYKYLYNVDTASYGWVLLNEQPPSLIRQAIYNKADMFTTEVDELPNPPYKVNDLWLNATYSEMGLTIYKNEILRCVRTKTSSLAPSINDWALSNDYSTDLDSFKNSYRNNMIAIAHQVDGYADTWTSVSDPASNWYNQSTGVDTREEHIGDIWQVGDEDSNTFRVYVKNANTNEYQWVTEDIPYLFKEAVKNNVRIFSTVDNVCPTPPYKKNDLWIGATFTYNGTSYVNELMRCINSKNRGQSGSFADWEVASEVSRKARTFIVGMPNTLPTPPYSVGDLWLNATYNGTVNGVDYHYSHEILQCVTPKGSEGTASITDWAVSNNYTDDSALTNFLLRYDKNLSIISSLIDRSSETYESATDPYSTWAEGSENLHVGDIWHNTSNNTYKIYSVSEDDGMYVYSWEDLGDDIPQLVLNAIKQNSRIFSTVGQATGTLPQPPYKVNDIWCGASFTGNGTTGTNNKIYTNEIMRCKVTRHKGATPQLNDWEFATNFTSLIDSIDATILTEQTWEVYTKPTLSNYPASGWVANGTENLHVGNMAYDMVTGKTYRFMMDEEELSVGYEWVEIQDLDIRQAAALAVEAGKHASNFAYESTTHGLVFSTSPITSDNGVTSLATLHTRLKADGLWIYLGQNALAKYGQTTVFYKYGTNNTAATLNLDGLQILNGAVGGIYVTNSDIHSGTHASVDSTNAGFYLGSNGTFSVGNSSGMLSFNGTSLSISYNGTDILTSLSEAAKTASSYLLYTSDGLCIYENTSLITNKPHIVLNSSGLHIYKGDKKLVTYGDDITFFKRQSSNGNVWYIETVKIDSTGLNMKYGSIQLGESTTYDSTTGTVVSNGYDFSVSSNGEVIARKGQIGSIKIGYVGQNNYLSSWIGNRTNYDLRNTSGITFENNANFGIGVPVSGASLNTILNFMISDAGNIEINRHYVSLNFSYRKALLSTESNFVEIYTKASSSSSEVGRMTITWTGAISTSGDISTAGSVTQGSDENRKNIIGNLIDYKDIFMNINPVYFTWNDREEDNIHFGIGAQTLKSSLNALGYDNLSLVKQGQDKYYYANYIELLMLSIPVIQEQENRIAKLEAELEELRKKVN